MSSKPPTPSPPMKICGTVRRPDRPLHHLGATPGVGRDVDLLEGDALPAQSRFAAKQ